MSPAAAAVPWRGPADNGGSDFDYRAAAKRLQASLAAVPGLFGSGLFSDPALMIVIDLFIAERDGRRLSVKSVCIGSGVPQSTALRYMDRLEEKGLIFRRSNPDDRRSAHIALAPGVAPKIEALLRGLFNLRLA